MAKIDLVVTDLDGTLILYKQQYDSARAKVVEILSQAGFSEEETTTHRTMWDEIDVNMFATYGVWGKRFGVAAVAALAEMTGGHNYDVENAIFEAANSFKDTLCPPIEEMVTAMKDFKNSGIPVVVLTRGDSVIQKAKLTSLYNMDFTPTDFLVVPAKSEETFASIVREYKVNPINALAVGDSLEQDVVPALLSKYGHGIHISGVDTWAPLDLPTEHEVDNHSVETHAEAAELLATYM